MLNRRGLVRSDWKTRAPQRRGGIVEDIESVATCTVYYDGETR